MRVASRYEAVEAIASWNTSMSIDASLLASRVVKKALTGALRSACDWELAAKSLLTPSSSKGPPRARCGGARSVAILSVTFGGGGEAGN